MWQTFKLEFTDVENVRAAYDSIGLQNEVLQQMLLLALDDAMQETGEFVDMLLEMSDEESEPDLDPDVVELFPLGPGPS
jgi:hypothetical protein